MVKLKKVLVLSFCILFCFSFFIGCSHAKTQGLEEYLSELRTDTFFGQTDTLKLKAHYGFKETPYDNDSKVMQKRYYLSFILPEAIDFNAEYRVEFSFNGVNYSDKFLHNPTNDRLSVSFEIENFDLKSFDVKISKASDIVNVNLVSLLPKDTISYVNALSCLVKNQKELIDSYYDQNGRFTAEIRMKVLVKDNKSYWYVGFCTAKGGLKALLVDGLSGQVLAIREVF